MKQRLLLSVLASIAIVAVVAVMVLTHDGRGQATKIVDCLGQDGYTSSVYHDDGRVPAAGQDPDIALLLGDDDGMIQARPPSDLVLVWNRAGIEIAAITVSEDGSIKLRFEAGQAHRARGVAACVPQRD